MKTALLFLVNTILVTGSLATEDTCNAIPIEEWGGSSTLHVEDLPTPVNIVVVTHTETIDCYTDEDCERLATNIRKNHINLGRRDIGLSFLIGGNGKIYEGAGWKVGGHTYYYNHKSISVSFMGTFHDKEPTDEALAAAKNFMGCVLNTRYIGCEYSLVGHRQLTVTSSPGDALQRIIETWPHWTSDISEL